MAENNPAASPQSALISDALQEQLRPVLAKLNRDVELISILDGQDAKSDELRGFMEVIASLSPHLTARFYRKGEQPALDAELGADYLPVSGLYEPGGSFSGLAFHGVPGGKEINSLVLALYNFAGPGQPIPPRLEKNIRALNVKADVKVCVSLNCSYCPDTVAACQRIAALNPNISACMIDARLYPALVERYKISNVPVVIVNDSEVHVGGKTVEDMYGILKKLR